MELHEIETCLQNPDFKARLKAIRELNNYEAEVAVPLLISQAQVSDFLVRSFVAMGLGKKHTEESFATLLDIIRSDRDYNVRAEAANSLANFGEIAISHLVTFFHQDSNWLVRYSILAALAELNINDSLFDVCICGINSEEITVKEACIEALSLFINTPKQEEALEQLLLIINADNWQIRAKVAKALKGFSNPRAQAGLKQLQQDSDPRVISASQLN